MILTQAAQQSPPHFFVARPAPDFRHKKGAQTGAKKCGKYIFSVCVAGWMPLLALLRITFPKPSIIYFTPPYTTIPTRGHYQRHYPPPQKVFLLALPFPIPRRRGIAAAAENTAKNTVAASIEFAQPSAAHITVRINYPVSQQDAC